MPYEVPSEFVALIAAGLLVLATRWVFGSSRPRSRLPLDAPDGTELGLLTVVASGVSRTDAAELRARLDAAGVRASVSRRRDGRADLLVFRDDLDRAQSVLGP